LVGLKVGTTAGKHWSLQSCLQCSTAHSTTLSLTSSFSALYIAEELEHSSQPTIHATAMSDDDDFMQDSGDEQYVSTDTTPQLG
jgi:hypothetical protein